MGNNSNFVHLHVHTDYSLLDGACAIPTLCKRAKELGMTALAITDHGNLFGLIDFFEAAKKNGIKPLLGCEIYLVYDHKQTEKPERGQHKYYHMGVLAQNLVGYQNLTKLVSRSHTRGFYYKPRADMEEIARYSEGLIGFTGCLQGVVPRFLSQGEYKKAREALGKFIDIFGKDRYFVELQDHGIQEQRQVNVGLLQLATEFELKVICSNDVHYVHENDWAPHDSLLCIQTGSKLSDERRLRYTSHQFFLKSYEEMLKVFGECPQALTNTLCIPEMCDLEIPFGKNQYPVFKRTQKALELYSTNFDYIHFLCKNGLKERYGLDYIKPQDRKEEVDQKAKELSQRLDYELDNIQKSGFIDYFLIVWDFIFWAKSQGIPVGPGRGSGAGCLVAYVLGITNIDPIRFKLLFERFLNPERVSPPDFDIDFCMKRRGEVIEYVRQKYGQDAVANIVTFGTFGAKMVVRDLARINDVPYAEADRIAKMIPDEIGISLEDAVHKSPELQFEMRKTPLVAQIIDQGKVIEGMVRNVGTHAAGIIIADKPLMELVPVTIQEGALTTQYPKDPLEALGLLKMDFLGLKTLTIIAQAQEHIRFLSNILDFDIDAVSFEDAKTYQLLNEAKTIGVFQLESGGMQALCKQFGISSIDEIVALIALYRPGPMDLIPDYIKGKNDPSTIKYPHPLLEDVCHETYGIMVYQEQVMEAAKRIAGYSLGGADILRRAMGKKKPEEMAKQRQIFIEGAKKTNNINPQKAEEIFNLLEKFAGYGFNKSHSAAYAILSYQTAYLKANFPVEFMAAVLSSELGHAEKLAHYLDECLAMEIAILSPDINQSLQAFTPIIAGKRAIRFGLAGIKGVGDAAAIKVLEERKKNGPFLSFSDFVQRIDSKVLNKRTLECLIKTGAFDEFKVDRQHLLDSMEAILQEAAGLNKDKLSGQTSLFDFLDTAQSYKGEQTALKTNGPTLPLSDKLSYEKELLGFYISGHPMNEYAGIVENLNSFEDEISYQKLEDNTAFRICGIISGLNKRFTKKDNKQWAFFNVCTIKSSFQVNIFPDAFEKCGHRLQEGLAVLVEGTVRVKEGQIRLNGHSVFLLKERLCTVIKSVTCVLHADIRVNTFLETISEWIQNNEGLTQLKLEFQIGKGEYLQADIAQSLTFRFNAQVFQEWLKNPAIVTIKLDVLPIEEPPVRSFNSKNVS